MLLAAIEAVTKANPVGPSRCLDAQVAAQAAAGESVHSASPLEAMGAGGLCEQYVLPGIAALFGLVATPCSQQARSCPGKPTVAPRPGFHTLCLSFPQARPSRATGDLDSATEQDLRQRPSGAAADRS